MKKLLLSALALTLATLTNAQSNFITVWTSTTTITSLDFYAVTQGGAVNYTWTAAPSGNSGVGSFTQLTFGVKTATLNAPANNTVTISMAPNNLKMWGTNYLPDGLKLIDVSQWGSSNWTGINFGGAENLNISATDIPNLSSVTDLYQTFSDCKKLTGPNNINAWDVSTVNNLYYTFQNCSLFNQPLSNWNVGSVTTMEGLFQGTSSFNQNLSTWNTSSVTSMNATFRNATAFNQPLNTWNVANVTTMYDMFNEATAFNQPLNNWNTVSVADMGWMFHKASNFNQNINSWNTSNVTNMFTMFYGASAFNQPLNNWNTSNVTTMQAMFAEATNFNQPLNSWNLSNVTSIGAMFVDADNFNQPLDNWNTGQVIDMNGAFGSFNSFNQNIGNWDLHSVIYSYNMLGGVAMDCNNYSATLIGWSTNTLTPNNLDLGTLPSITYGTNAVSARANLTGTKSWTITGDMAGSTNCSLTTGITSNEINNSLSIYPNPVQNVITINSSIALNKIIVTDVLGKTVLSLSTNDATASVDLSALNGGVYFITTNGVTKKIIKE